MNAVFQDLVNSWEHVTAILLFVQTILVLRVHMSSLTVFEFWFVLFCPFAAVRGDSCVGYRGRTTAHSFTGWWRLHPAYPVLQWEAGERRARADNRGTNREIYTTTCAVALLYECEQTFIIIIIYSAPVLKDRCPADFSSNQTPLNNILSNLRLLLPLLSFVMLVQVCLIRDEAKF